MKGYIFRCNKKTKSEVFERKLFGEEESVWGSMSKIKPDDLLFLYNTSTFEISGPFKPTSEPAKNIVKGGWQGKFPVQIKFEATEQTKTIPFTKIQHIIKRYRNGIYPWPDVSEEQTNQILLFQK